ncbi:MAG: hypothetical protein ACKOZU_03140 [Planctomycetaceae bacterium]
MTRPPRESLAAATTSSRGPVASRPESAADHAWRVVTLSRSRLRVAGPREHVAWGARTLGDWTSCLDGAAGLVNLVGRTVDCVKTPGHCDEILRSRVEATRVLGTACVASGTAD